MLQHFCVLDICKQSQSRNEMSVNDYLKIFRFKVSPAWNEPCQGWVDSLNGPIGIMVGGAKGVIRTMLCNGEHRSEVIPVDIAINGLIAIAYKIATTKQK